MQDGADLGEGDEEDRSLLTRIAEGDHVAFRSLVERHLDRMLSLSVRLIGDQTLAERLVEDAMLEIWKIRADWQDSQELLRHWLYGRIVRGSLTLAQLVPATRAAKADQTAFPYDAILAQLPLTQRAAAMLSLNEQLPTGLIADIIGTDEHTVTDLVKTARRHLRLSLRTSINRTLA